MSPGHIRCANRCASQPNSDSSLRPSVFHRSSYAKLALASSGRHPRLVVGTSPRAAPRQHITTTAQLGGASATQAARYVSPAWLSYDRVGFWLALAAVTALAAALPTVIEVIIKPIVTPVRCKTCRGATTVLCPTCHARGKIGGLFTGQPLQMCGVCSGAGRLSCSQCQGAGMWNSWLWHTDMSRGAGAAPPAAKGVDGWLEANTPAAETGQGTSAEGESSGDDEPSPWPELGEATKLSFRGRVAVQREQRERQKLRDGSS